MRRTVVAAALIIVATLIAVYAISRARKPAPPPGMVYVPGGEYRMGTDDAEGWADEKPAHLVRVPPFFMDETEVTNAEFRAFVEATGYQTTAERAPTLEEVMSQVAPGTPPPARGDLVAGALVFTPIAEGPVDTRDFSQWWTWTPGASWRHPEGPGSNLDGRESHPVIHVSWDDAAAYAKWAGKRLPSEAEWELAARGGLDGKPYVWGDAPPDPRRANLWQGTFPSLNTAADGFARTAPVRSFPPNGYGLYDMAGNVWEWCQDYYERGLHARLAAAGGVAVDPRGPDRTIDPLKPNETMRVQKGGAFLCHDAYCSRYRPSARHGGGQDTGKSHVGFRCARSIE